MYGLDYFDLRYEDKLSKNLLKLYNNTLKEMAIDIENITNRYYKRNYKMSELIKIRQTVGLYNNIFSKIENLGLLTKNEIDKYVLSALEDGILTDNYMVNSQLKFILPIPNINQTAVNYALNNTAFERAVKDIPQSLKVDIENIIGNNILRGKNYREISKQIVPILYGNKTKAERIARTESGRCYSIGQLENNNVMSQNGLTYKKIWITLRDKKVRKDHLKMERKEADRNGIFHLPDGSICEAPRLTGIARQDINCRCGYISEITGLTDPALQQKYLEADSKMKIELEEYIRNNKAVFKYE
jgi:hypothetical protein